MYDNNMGKKDLETCKFEKRYEIIIRQFNSRMLRKNESCCI